VVVVVLLRVTGVVVVVVAIFEFPGICRAHPPRLVRAADVAQDDRLYDVRPLQVAVSDANQ
jgi:hypothetical protein